MAKSKKSQVAIDIATAVAIAVPLLIAGQPGAAMAALSAASPSLLIGVSKLLAAPPQSNADVAWSILSKSYAIGLAKFLARAKIERRPEGSELRELVERLVTRAEIIAQAEDQRLSSDLFVSPLKVPFLRDAAKNLFHELKPFNLTSSVIDMRQFFETCVAEAMADLRSADPKPFAAFEQSLTGVFVEADEKRRGLARHHAAIIRDFTQRPVFGQEDTGITLSDLYVRQRAVWNTKQIQAKGTEADQESDAGQDSFFYDERHPRRWSYPLHIDDLHATVWSWLDGGNSSDALRLIAGGPGSGKSTFARAIAVEAIDSAKFDVLLVPLQEIEPTGPFKERIEHLFRDRTDLGLDTVPNPLLWLGQRDASGSPPAKPLLLICDGLDEIAQPDSAEATSVTTDFVQTLKSWMESRNSGGLYTYSIVLGRTISAQEAFNKAGIDTSALLRVGGLLPITETEEWRNANEIGLVNDVRGLALVDQRADFWAKWVAASDVETADLPAALQGDTDAAAALRELTTEPLLLYLLLWTGYLGDRWELAADNRNNVYDEIFRQIYTRRWGGGSAQKATRNREGGGHTSIKALTQDEFFSLQEALGLAAWTTGGRTVSVESYQSMLQTYLNPDMYDDFDGDLASSLKSVALQSYTRTVGGENAGYEFVHKSLGEYLLARGLATWVLNCLEPLTDRQSDSRCVTAASNFSKITWHGPLTVEIARFYEDELRLRLKTPDSARTSLRKIVPLANWVLGNGMPVHREVPPAYNFSKITAAEHRSLDVLWTALQSIAKQAFPNSSFGMPETSHGWKQGALKLSWPSEYGFAALYEKLSTPALLSETKRMPRFDYLNLSGQVLSEMSLLVVLQAYTKARWAYSRDRFPVSLMGVDLTDAQLQGCNLMDANLRRADLSRARMPRVILTRANLDQAVLRKANLAKAKLYRTRLVGADLTNADVTGTSIARSDLRGAKLRSVRVRPGLDRSDEGYFAVHMSMFEGADFQNSRLGNAIFSDCWLGDTDFLGADLSAVIFLNSKMQTGKTDEFDLQSLPRANVSLNFKAGRTEDSDPVAMLLYSDRREPVFMPINPRKR